MAKPNINLSRFANLGGSNLLVPSSGLRDTGFEDDTPAEPGYVNELFAQAYAWASYINTGILDPVVHVSDGFYGGTGGTFTFATPVVTFTVTSGLTVPEMVGQSVTIADAISAGNEGTFTITGQTATTLTWNNASGVAEAFTGTWTTDLAGSLHAVGDVKMDGDLKVDGNIQATTTFATIKGYNVHHTGERTLHINCGSAIKDEGVAGPVFGIATNEGVWAAGTTTAQLLYPIPVRSGDRIKSWKLFIGKYSASGTVTAKLYKSGTGAGLPTQIGTTKTDARNNPGEVFMSETGLDHAVLDDFAYYLVVNGGGITGDLFRDLHVNVTNPG